MARKPTGPKWFDSKQSYFVTIKGIRHNLGPDLETAEAKFHQLMGGEAQDKVLGRRLGNVAAEFLEWVEKNRSPKTLEWYSLYVLEFVDHFGERRLCHQIDPHEIDTWLHRRYKDATDNGRLGVLRAVSRLFNWAIKSQRLKGMTNPVTGVERPAYQPRQTYLREEPWGRLIKLVEDDPIHDLIVFMRETGCRPQEARTMTAANFNRESRLMKWGSDATGKFKNRRILLNDTALATVERLSLKHPEGSLMRDAEGREWTASALAGRFDRLSKTLKVKFSAYTIRFTFCTDALKAGVDPIDVARLMGHKDLSMIMKVYNQMQLEDPEMLERLNKATKRKGA